MLNKLVVNRDMYENSCQNWPVNKDESQSNGITVVETAFLALADRWGLDEIIPKNTASENLLCGDKDNPGHPSCVCAFEHTVPVGRMNMALRAGYEHYFPVNENQITESCEGQSGLIFNHSDLAFEARLLSTESDAVTRTKTPRLQPIELIAETSCSLIHWFISVVLERKNIGSRMS